MFNYSSGITQQPVKPKRHKRPNRANRYTVTCDLVTLQAGLDAEIKRLTLLKEDVTKVNRRVTDTWLKHISTKQLNDKMEFYTSELKSIHNIISI